MRAQQQADTALFDRLDRDGGTIVAHNRGVGSIVILTPGFILTVGSGEDDEPTMAGQIPLAAVGPDGDALVAQGWQLSDQGLEREWPIRSATDRLAILRDVDQAIDLLAARRGLTRASFPLRHVSPLSSDAGYSQVGCVLALVSALIGDLLGTAALVVFHSEWLFREGDPIGEIVGGLVTGWVVALIIAVVGGLFVIGVGLMSVIERIPRLARESPGIYIVLMMIAPAAIAAISLWWLASVNR